jgi:hypothetical protein
MSKLSNDCIGLFYFQVGWEGGGVVWGWLYLINSLQNKTQKTLSDPLLYRRPLLLRQLKNNQNQTNTTGVQNFKEFNNSAGWLSVFLCSLHQILQTFTVSFLKYLNLCFSWKVPRKKWNCRGKLSHTHPLLVFLFMR